MNDFYVLTPKDKIITTTAIPGSGGVGESGWIVFENGCMYMSRPKWGTTKPTFAPKSSARFDKDVLLPNGDIFLCNGSNKIIVRETGKVSMCMTFSDDQRAPQDPVSTDEPIPAKFLVGSDIKFPLSTGNGAMLQENGDIVFSNGNRFMRSLSKVNKPDGSSFIDYDVINTANKIYPVNNKANPLDPDYWNKIVDDATKETNTQNDPGQGNSSGSSDSTTDNSDDPDGTSSNTGLIVGLCLSVVAIAGIAIGIRGSKKRKSKS